VNKKRRCLTGRDGRPEGRHAMRSGLTEWV